MKQAILVAAPLALACLLVPMGSVASDPPRSEGWALGYSIGFQVGGDFRRSGRALDPDLLVEGLLHALAGKTPRLEPAEMTSALRALQDRESPGEAAGSTGPGTSPETARTSR